MTAEQILKSYGFSWGRMICASKSEYRKRHPDNLIVFNSAIVSKSGLALTSVDLDLTIDSEKLTCAAKEIGEFFVLRESDSWSIGEESYEQLKQKAVKIYD